MLGNIEGKRRRGRQRMGWLGGSTDSVDVSPSRPREMVKDGKPGVLQFMGSQRVGHNLAIEQYIKISIYIRLINVAAFISKGKGKVLFAQPLQTHDELLHNKKTAHREYSGRVHWRVG